VRVWRIDLPTVLTNLKSWAADVGRDENVASVVLFGSIARGDATAASDANVLILLHASSRDFLQRIPQFLPVSLGIGVDVFPYTIEEAARALDEGWGVVRSALEEGVVLFERNASLAPLRAALEDPMSRGKKADGPHAASGPGSLRPESEALR